nr:hypothetical protein [Sicyoidochytrium minutum DNA virus]
MLYNYFFGRISPGTDRKLFYLGIFAILFIIGAVYGATYYFAIALPNSEDSSEDTPSGVVNSGNVLSDNGPLNVFLWLVLIFGGLLFLALLAILATKATDYLGWTDSSSWREKPLTEALEVEDSRFNKPAPYAEAVEFAERVPGYQGEVSYYQNVRGGRWHRGRIGVFNYPEPV